MQRPSFAEFRFKVRRVLLHFTWGGEWAVVLPGHIKHNLYWFFFDGLFASASDNIAITYLVLYILALGASRAQIGLMSSFSNFLGALVLMPGALLVERLGHRKEISMASVGAARSVLLVFALLPFLVKGPALVLVAIALSVMRDSFNYLAFPAWMSVVGEIVPIGGRGRFFASRNFIMGITGMLAILLVGELITRTGQLHGYQLALALAFVFGASSTFSFSHLSDPMGRAPLPIEERSSLRVVVTGMRTNQTFLAFSLVMVLWNFSINIAGPFFNVFMVQDLRFSATMVGLASIASTTAGLLVQPRIGKLSDRWGPRKVQLISMLIIPLVPAAWIFVTSFWHVVAINIFSGAVWGVFNLVSFNFLLSLTPAAQRARFAAIYQILITLSLSLGAALGAWVVTIWGFTGVFACSAVGRTVAGILFLRFVPGSSPVDGREIREGESA